MCRQSWCWCARLLCARFGVEQTKPDGRVKVRPIDNFSWSMIDGGSKREVKEWSVNGHTIAGEKLGHDTLDALGKGCGVADMCVRSHRIPLDRRCVAAISCRCGMCARPVQGESQQQRRLVVP